MATPIQTTSYGDSRHSSADDLLAPLPAAPPRLSGAGPFVINLGASSTPIEPQAVNIPGCEHALVYQIQRSEDRRIRFRLRFGPFASEDEIDGILEKVRCIYPSALPATADSDDLRAIAALQAKAQSNKSPARRPAATPAAVAAEPAAASPALAAGPAINPVPELSLAPEFTPTPTPAPPLAAGPAITLAPELSLAPEFTPTPTRTPRPAPALAAAAAPARPAAPALARAPAPAPRRAPSSDAAQADLVLTQLEAREESAMGWFVIQLMLAENPIDVDRVPKHDIFKAYRLYSVAGLDQGRVMHALRLGFFKEQSAAQAVASYLGAFYEQPSVKRVNGAERDRFADRRVDPRRDAGPGAPATIEITDDRYVRPKSIQKSMQGSASAKSR